MDYKAFLPTDNGQIHLLLPSGIGDILWVYSHLYELNETRDVTWWMSDDEQHRGGEILRLLGCKSGYLPGLSTNWVWDQHGSPFITEKGGVYPVHANWHLEHGFKLEDWYKEIPFKTPRIPTLSVSPLDTIFKPKYVLMFMSSAAYMGGQMMPAMWGRICHKIQRDIAPVRFCGAAGDVDFAQQVEQYYQSPYKPIYNQSIEVVMAAAEKSIGMVGMASGPLICATYQGVRTFSAYPRHLSKMPGTWEHGADAEWTYTDTLYDDVRDGKVSEFLARESDV